MMGCPTHRSMYSIEFARTACRLTSHDACLRGKSYNASNSARCNVQVMGDEDCAFEATHVHHVEFCTLWDVTTVAEMPMHGRKRARTWW
jgi:hypothetical protein